MDSTVPIVNLVSKSFLIPIGNWLGLISSEDRELNDEGLGSILTNIPGSNMEAQDSSNHFSDTLQDHGKGQVAQKKKYFWNNWAVIGGAVASKPKETKTGSSKHSEWKVIGAASGSTKPKEPEIDFPDEKQPQHVEVKIDEVHTEQEVVPAESTALLAHREVPPVPARNLGPEILKSIVYGGLTESVASLSVVTSAASADATTLNIVTLAMANLMGGLFVLLHNLAELKAEKPRRAENHTDAQVDQYNELLGQRKHFILHAFIAILSFIVFGLVPPLVYGFSFNESDDKDFKLAAVAGASLLCITLLSIAKAHTKRPNNCFTYFQTVLYYVTTGALASLLSYLAGVFVKKLMQKLGWFQTPSNFAMQIPRISVLQQQPSMKDK
ncbi:hypothetical protein RJT34_22100 [Clitoria ternatea]|uniref:Membrane protein of ER body-like protein n=1 Tax=Clitoria ternatea TaxID=43366 RepID=A0AAN9IVK0_CLITE